MNHTGKNYEEMTLEELQREAWEALMDTDIIDGPLTLELEKIREALNWKRPVEYLYTPEESWAIFLEKNAEEPALRPEPGTGARSSEGGAKHPRGLSGGGKRPARANALIRRVLIAAVIVVLLTGAVLAADSLGLWAWVPRWNAAAGRYEPAAQEVSGESPIPAALAELGITEPVYPAKLPEGFVITESHISEDPLVMMEQYARGNERLSITITPVKAVKSTIFQKSGATVREYRSGAKAFFLFQNEGTITAVWFTKDYATTISANLSVEEITAIIDSIDATSEGGQLT